MVAEETSAPGTAVPRASGDGSAASVSEGARPLSYGGGFVIVPLMQADVVGRLHWMAGPEFLNAASLGQLTPGPFAQTIAVVGYSVAGIFGGLLAAAVAFTRRWCSSHSAPSASGSSVPTAGARLPPRCRPGLGGGDPRIGGRSRPRRHPVVAVRRPGGRGARAATAPPCGHHPADRRTDRRRRRPAGRSPPGLSPCVVTCGSGAARPARASYRQQIARSHQEPGILMHAARSHDLYCPSCL